MAFSSFFSGIVEAVAPTSTPSQKFITLLESGKVSLALGLLDDADADLDLGLKNEGGNSAIHLASAHGFTDVIKRILARRSQSLQEISGTQGSTPLHLASRGGHLSSVKCLLAAGASTSSQDALGRTAADVAQTTQVKQSIIAATVAAKKKPTEADYTHGDGQTERVTIVKAHADSEGGGYTIFVPSLGRERQTVRERLRLHDGPPPGMTKMDLKRAAHEKRKKMESSSSSSGGGIAAAVAEGMAVVGAAADGLLGVGGADQGATGGI